MFVSYNKEGCSAPECRVGNWQEEKALLSVTGYTRGPRPQEKNYNLNAVRCIDHTERTLPKDYNTSHREQHSDPANAVHAQVRATEGQRSRRQLAAIQAQVEAEFDGKARKAEEQARRGDFTSQHRMHFTAAPRDTYLQARTFRTVGPKKEEPELPPYRETHYTEGNAFDVITLYSESKKSKDPLRRLPGTFEQNKRNPFLRSAALTNDIRDPYKFQVEGHLCYEEGRKLYADALK